jgi:predicted chitinase/uncharacterized protein YukE
MADTIVASPGTTTPGNTGATNQVQNLLTHIKSTGDAFDKGDYLGGAMGVTNVALDIIGIAGDPMGAISSAGVGWVLNAVSFLREPFDILMGNPSAISGSAQSWMSAANSLSSTAQQYRQASTSQTTSWQGNAGNGYRTASGNQASGLEALAKASQTVSAAMSKAGQAVAQARKIVLDLINEAVQKIIQICIEALSSSWLTFGASVAMGIAQSVQKAVSTAQKLLKEIKQVVDTLRQIIQTVQQILQLVQQVKQLLQQIGGKASNQQQVQPQGQAVGYRPDTSGYYDPSKVGYSGTTTPTSAELGDLSALPQIPQVRSSDIGLAVLRAVMPQLSEAKAKLYIPLLNAAMAEAGITTPQRQAAFLAQLAHESGQFRYMQEIASGSAYEGRRDLGNVNPGDGQLYKGRGPIQLTGRANYRAAGEALGLDLEANPRQAAEPSVGFRTAAWYWNSRQLNDYADTGDFREITRRINGGYNGLADRERYYAAAKQALGL